MSKLAKISALVALLAAIGAAPAFADRGVPMPLRTDGRIKSLVYNEHEVFEVTAHYGYQTLIQFAAAEEIQNISIGDSIAWQVVPNNAGNMIFLKPVEDNAATNLNVVTDQRVYSFYLNAREPRGRNDPSITYRVIFNYPEDEMELLLAHDGRERQSRGATIARGLDGSDPSSWNFNYTFSGDDALVPVRIFDNGEFTYFQFDPATDTPAIFRVNPDSTEALVNHHIEGPYVVVQRTARQFTLRDGDTVTCIYNETYSRAPDLDIGSPRNRDDVRTSVTSQPAEPRSVSRFPGSEG